MFKCSNHDQVCCPGSVARPRILSLKTLTFFACARDKESAFPEQVYMQPSGLLSMSGLASSTPFLRRFFDSWKVKPHFVAREEYKNIINQFTQASLPSPARARPLTLTIQGYCMKAVFYSED